jgi:protein-tyrosine phosphatase
MISILNFFKPKGITENPILVDMHSHLLPGLDDGSESIEESITLIKNFADLGFKKLITTPHIMGDHYKNNKEGISSKLKELQKRAEKENINIQLEAAAEYYLDEFFLSLLNHPSELLTFGKNYILFETSYINEPTHLYEAIFLMQAQGLKPVLAHPERYTYLYSDFNRYKEIYEKGVLFQLNTNSLCGYYSKSAKNIAMKLIKNKMVDFIGSDCHAIRHMEALQKTHKIRIYQKAMELNLLNNTLL